MEFLFNSTYIQLNEIADYYNVIYNNLFFNMLKFHIKSTQKALNSKILATTLIDFFSDALFKSRPVS